MTKMTMTYLVAAATAVMLGACGSSSSNSSGGGTFSTSVPSNKVLSTLTPAEAATLCMDVGKAFSDSTLKDPTCKFTAYFLVAVSAATDAALTDAELKTMCTQAYTACQTEPVDGGGADMCMQPDATCTATVAELSACVKESKTALVTTFNAVPSCSAITRASLEVSASDGGTTPMQGPACTTFETKCPDIMVTP